MPADIIARETRTTIAASVRRTVAVTVSAIAVIVSAPEACNAQANASDPVRALVVSREPALSQGPQTDPVVARVDGVEIRESDLGLAEDVLGKDPVSRADNTTRQNLIKYVEETIILSNAAKKQNWADDPEMQRQLQRRADFARNRFLMERLLQNTAIAAVSDEALRKEYDRQVEEAKTDIEVHLHSITFLFKDPKDELEVKAAEIKARQAIKRLENGEDFAAVARAVSDNPAERLRSGDVGYLNRQMLGNDLADAAFNIEFGKISQPVKTPTGFRVIKVDDRRARRMPDYQFALKGIRLQMARQAQLDLVSSLQAGAKVELLDKTGAGGTTDEAAK